MMLQLLGPKFEVDPRKFFASLGCGSEFNPLLKCWDVNRFENVLYHPQVGRPELSSLCLLVLIPPMTDQNSSVHAIDILGIAILSEGYGNDC